MQRTYSDGMTPSQVFGNWEEGESLPARREERSRGGSQWMAEF